MFFFFELVECNVKYIFEWTRTITNVMLNSVIFVDFFRLNHFVWQVFPTKWLIHRRVIWILFIYAWKNINNSDAAITANAIFTSIFGHSLVLSFLVHTFVPHVHSKKQTSPYALFLLFASKRFNENRVEKKKTLTASNNLKIHVI